MADIKQTDPSKILTTSLSDISGLNPMRITSILNTLRTNTVAASTAIVEANLKAAASYKTLVSAEVGTQRYLARNVPSLANTNQAARSMPRMMQEPRVNMDLAREVSSAQNSVIESIKQQVDASRRRFAASRRFTPMPDITMGSESVEYNQEFLNELIARKAELEARRRRISEEAASRPRKEVRTAVAAPVQERDPREFYVDREQVSRKVAEYDSIVARIVKQKEQMQRAAGILSRADKALDLFPDAAYGPGGSPGARFYEKLVRITRASSVGQLAAAPRQTEEQLDKIIRSMESGRGGRFRLMGGRYSISPDWFSAYGFGPEARNPHFREYATGRYSPPFSMLTNLGGSAAPNMGWGPGRPDARDPRYYTSGPVGPNSFRMQAARPPGLLLPGPGETSKPIEPQIVDTGFVLVSPEMVKLRERMQQLALPARQSYPLLPAPRQQLLLPGPGQTSHPETYIRPGEVGEMSVLDLVRRELAAAKLPFPQRTVPWGQTRYPSPSTGTIAIPGLSDMGTVTTMGPTRDWRYGFVPKLRKEDLGEFTPETYQLLPQTYKQRDVVRRMEELANAETRLSAATADATQKIAGQADAQTTNTMRSGLSLDEEFNLGPNASAAERRRAEKERDRAIKKAEREAEERRKHAALQSSLDYLPGGEETKRSLLEKAGSVEFTRRVKRADGEWELERSRLGEGDVRDVKHHYGGTTDIRFAAKDANEVMQEYSATIDKYGRISTRANKRTLDFASAVGKETLEFMKWSLAISLVLIPLQKLGELTQKAVENQKQLADILIITNQAQAAGNTIFSAAADIASETGENVNNVLGAYAMAYRVTGNAANATQRYVQTNKLLKDSLILSKLSGMDAAESIDILSAAINQTNGKFDEGQSLINKWVAVSKVANVDVKTLATGFAVVAEAADDAQLSVDELNGLMATIAATGTTSAKETANVARSLIGGLQSDKAKKTLLAYGIAFQDAEGNARGFYDVVKDIYDMKELGILSDTQVSEITRAWGGGTRRQAAVASFLSRFDMVRKVAEESERANLQSGEAMAALAVQSATVSFGLNKLETAFSNLAQTIGTKGGILDLFSTLLGMMTGITNGAAGLAGVLGRTTLPLVAMLAAAGISKKAGPDFIPNMRKKFGGLADVTYGIGSFVRPDRQALQAASYITNRRSGFVMGEDADRFKGWLASQGAIESMASARLERREGFRQHLERNAGRYLSGALMAGNVVGNLVDETATSKQKSTRVVADIAGGLAGALISKGNPIGTQIGMSMAEAFANAVVLYEPQFTDLYNNILADTKLTVGSIEEDALSKGQKALGEEVFKGAGGGSMIMGTILSFLGSTFGNWFDPKVAKGMNTYEAAMLAYKSTLTPEQIADLEKRQNALMATNLGITTGGLQTAAFRDKQLSYQTANKEISTDVAKGFIEQLRDRLLAGEITQTEFGTGVQRLSGLSVTGSQYMATFGEKYMRDFSKTTEDMYDIFGNVAANATQEEIDQLNNFAAQVATYEQQMSLLTVGTAEYNDALNNYVLATENATVYTNELTKALSTRINLKDMIDLESLTAKEFELILPKAYESWERDLREQLKAGVFASEDRMYEYMAGQPEKIYKMGEGNEYKISNVPDTYVADAVKKAEESGLISQKMGVSFMDATDAQLQEALSKYESYTQMLEAKGYERDETAEVVVTKDETVDVYKKDWKIVQYLLGEIIDNQEDQMEGLYNFPADMFAMVAYDAALKQGTGETVVPETVTPTLGPNELYPQEDPYPKASMSWEEIKGHLGRAKTRAQIRDEGAPGRDEWEKRWKDMRTYQQFPEGITYATEQLFKEIPGPVNKWERFMRPGYMRTIKGLRSGDIPTPGLIGNPYPSEIDGGLRWSRYGLGAGHTGGAIATGPQASAGVGTLGASTASMVMPMMLLSGLLKGLSGMQSTGTISGGAKQSNTSGLAQEISGIAKNLSTKLTVQVDNKISLTVDGRQLAFVMKRYMKEDLVRYGAAGGAVTRTNVI